MTDIDQPIEYTLDPPPPAPERRRRRLSARAVALSALLLGGAGGAAILGPIVASAASPTASASTSPSSPGDSDHHRGPGWGPGGGHAEEVSDTSVIAKAIGITESALITELQAGKTPAQVATAHGVTVQKVIDALVADGVSELAADVKAGRLTQAQADSMKAQVTQRATDQVDNGFRGEIH